jgi:hypothetical protein
MLDVLVDGLVVLDDITLDTGAGPATFTFMADTGATIRTVWTPGGWPYEASYCIYDFLGNELGCDGRGAVEPADITVTGFCKEAVSGNPEPDADVDLAEVAGFQRAITAAP